MHWIFDKRTAVQFWEFHRPGWCMYWAQVYWCLNFTSECLHISRATDTFTNCIKDVNRSEFVYLPNKSYVLSPFIKTFHSLFELGSYWMHWITRLYWNSGVSWWKFVKWWVWFHLYGKKNFWTFRLIKWNRNLDSRISQTIYMLLFRPSLRKAKCWDSFIPGNQLLFSMLKIISEIILRIQHAFLRNIYVKKGRTIPLQAWTGPEDSRRLRLPDFKTIGT